MNRLQFEYSPYLVSHAADPVDWLPWGPEALARARAEHKPLFIAVGTASQNHGIGNTAGRLAGRYFVPVQVDAREHPDAAAYYLQAARRLGGCLEGPVQALATPEGRPFYAARPMGGVELAAMLSAAALHWQSDPAGYERVAAVLENTLLPPLCKGRCPAGAEGLSQQGNLHDAAIPDCCTYPSVSYADSSPCKGEPRGAQRRYDTHFRLLQSHFDREYGGFGTGAKWLLPQELLFLLRCGTPEAMDMALFTLNQMARSPVRDHIGGGFFHSTAHRAWQKPVPEKRLSDQAWMLECYVSAYEATGESHFAEIARDTADFVLRELQHEGGGFYTAQWSEDGFYEAFCPTPLAPPPGELSAKLTERALSEHRLELYRARLERGMPRREETIFVGQNGVMVAALCRAGQVLDAQRYISAALQADKFLRQRLVSAMDLRRYWTHGACVGDGALEDYAGYALGQLALYEAGCGRAHLHRAAKLMARADALFSDRLGGGYFLTRPEGCLPLRPKQLWDESMPSAWSLAAEVLQRLAKETGHPGFCQRAREIGLQLNEYCGYGLTAVMQL